MSRALQEIICWASSEDPFLITVPTPWVSESTLPCKELILERRLVNSVLSHSKSCGFHVRSQLQVFPDEDHTSQIRLSFCTETENNLGNFCCKDCSSNQESFQNLHLSPLPTFHENAFSNHFESFSPPRTFFKSLHQRDSHWWEVLSEMPCILPTTHVTIILLFGETYSNSI